MRLRPFRFLLFPPLVATETERLRTFLFFSSFSSSFDASVTQTAFVPLFLLGALFICLSSTSRCSRFGQAKRFTFSEWLPSSPPPPPPPLQVLLPLTKASFAVSRERSSLDPTNHLSSWRCTTSSSCGWVKQKLRTFVAFRQ